MVISATLVPCVGIDSSATGVNCDSILVLVSLAMWVAVNCDSNLDASWSFDSIDGMNFDLIERGGSLDSTLSRVSLDLILMAIFDSTSRASLDLISRASRDLIVSESCDSIAATRSRLCSCTHWAMVSVIFASSYSTLAIYSQSAPILMASNCAISPQLSATWTHGRRWARLTSEPRSSVVAIGTRQCRARHFVDSPHNPPTTNCQNSSPTLFSLRRTLGLL